MKLDDVYAPDPDPPTIEKIRELQAQFGALADEFELWEPEDYEDQDKALEWFGKAVSDRLVTIGTDHSGSLYVLWCHGGCKLSEAPVAYLGGDGEGNTVLAKDLDAFFELLGDGSIWGPYDQEFFPPQDGEVDPEDPEGPAAFREHYRKTFGSPRAAATIRDEAVAAHPDFAAWVSAQLS